MKKRILQDKKGIDILVVEDSLTQAEQLKYLLKKNHYSVIVAEDGMQALEVLEQIEPKVILTDVCMPGMDGYEFCRKVKQLNLSEGLPVILLTSLSDPEDVIKGLECGADNFITKPYSEEYLLMQLERVIADLKNNRNDRVNIEYEIQFAGKRSLIKANQQQMLTLLVSTYEAAVIRNRELLKSQEQLQTLNDNLEKIVEERIQELALNEQKYWDLYDNAPAMFLSVDHLTGKVIECNETFLRKTSFNRSDVIGKLLFSLYHPDCIDTIIKNTQILHGGGEIKNSEADLITATGGKVQVLINSTALRDDNGNILYSRNVLQDISDLKKAQLELMHSEERYRAVTESAVDSIITVDDAGIIAGWNHGATKTFGYNENEIIGLPVDVLFPENYKSVYLNEFKCISQSEEHDIIGKTLELQVKRKDGEVFPIELSIAQWQTSNDQFYTGIIRDITNRKLAEIELRNAKENAEESDRLKTSFLQNLSHEIRTPMNAILGFSELLHDSDLKEKNREEFLGMINNATHHLLYIITDIVDISIIEAKLEATDMKAFNLNDLLKEVKNDFELQALQKNLSISLQNKIPNEQQNIISDPKKLRQILNNIIGNALKFTAKGTVKIEVDFNEQYLIFSISDTGIGIDPALHEVIFNRFRQVELALTKNYGGNGLGLSLAKSYIEMLGGSIRVDSTLGKGSTFYFEIPYQPVFSFTALTNKEKIYPNTLSWKDKTILLAEDDEMNSSYIQSVLKVTGINIVTAVNGLEAIEQCKNNHDISLVLMDVKMPEMDGLMATHFIKTLRKNLPIIATTAYALSSYREKCIEAGCDDYLAKPIKRDQLLGMMNKYL